MSFFISIRSAHFSDGGAITSADVAFTFNLLKEKGRPQQRAAYGLVKSVETPDALTVRYDLTGANDRELPLTLALMPVLSRAHTDAAHFDEQTLQIPISSGPYLVAEVKPGERLTLKRDPNYWARDLPINRGLYNFDEIRIDYYRDATAMFEAFKAGLYDFRIETDPTRWRNGYDFPALRDGRIVKDGGRQRPAQGHGGLRLQHAASDFRRRARARSAGDDVRFRMDQRQSLWRGLSPFEELFRRQRTVFGGAARLAARSARCSRPFPARCAPTSWRGDGRRRSPTAPAATGTLAHRALDAARRGRLRPEGRHPRECARRADRLRNPRQEPAGGAARARLCAEP